MRARFGGQLDLGVGFDAGAQFGGFLAHGFEALGAGLGGGAQGFEAVAVGFDGFFGGLGVLQRGGGGGGVHRGALLGQRAGARFGVGAAFGGARRLGFGFDAGDGFLDGAHFATWRAVGGAGAGTAGLLAGRW